ncbi:MAG: hypothetical protein CL609_10220 [Anaerolineaceae bacterium]|nr:hypothetical protein [Anaerolineaceae bacterium]
MNKTRIFNDRIIVVLFLLVTCIVCARFLHDMLPGHSDVITSSSGLCSGVVHFDIILGVVSGLVLIGLTIKSHHPHKLFIRLINLHVFDPPPRSLI